MAIFFERKDNVVAGTPIDMATNDQLFVVEGVTVGSTGGTGITMSGGGTQSHIYGAIIGLGGAGMLSGEGSQTITVGATGSVTGNTAGVHLTSDNNFIFNEGSITGAIGIVFDAAFVGSNSVFNSGSILSRSLAAIQANLGNNFISNTGELVALNSTAIEIFSEAADAANVIENFGTIVSQPESPAIITGDAPCTVRNAGGIEGAILFGGGDDTYDGEFGRVTGLVDGRTGDDTLIGGAGRETFTGGLDNDTIEGGGGRDVFVYAQARESGGKQLDTVIGFDARKDVFDISGNVTGIDATVNGGQLDTATFVTDLRDAIGAAALEVKHAVLFRPDAGAFAGHTLLIVDANNKAGYQANKDFVIDLRDADNIGSLDTGDFI
jgi:hypothetical protein